MNTDLSSSSGVLYSTASISVRGTRQSLTLMLEKSSAFWNMSTSLSIFSSSSAFSIEARIRLLSSVLEKVVSCDSLFIFVPMRRSRSVEHTVVKRDSGYSSMYIGYVMSAKRLSERLGFMRNSALGMNSPVNIMTIVDISSLLFFCCV